MSLPTPDLPPLCKVCGAKPVKWDGSHGRAKAGWRQFCSRECSGKDQMRSARMAEFNRERAKRFYVLAIKDAVGPGWRDGGPVLLAQLVKLARATYRIGYNAGLNANRAMDTKKPSNRECVYCGGPKDFYAEACRRCKKQLPARRKAA